MRFQDLRSVRPGQRCPENQPPSQPETQPQSQPSLLAKAAVFRIVLVAALAFFAAAATLSQQDEAPTHEPGVPPHNPLANPKPDANQRMQYEMQRQQNRKRIEELNLLRQKELRADTTKLLRLAAEVKAETAAPVSSTPSADSQSVLDLRKLEAIEKLARGVREKMTTTVN